MEQVVGFKRFSLVLVVPASGVMPVIWASILILLTACTAAPVKEHAAYSRTAVQHLYSLESWSMEGRLAVTGINDSWSAAINWGHKPESEDIKLSGPLGQGAVAIHLTGDFVTVSRGDDAVESSYQPEQFINQQLGLVVPVRSLRYWALGLPRPDQAFEDVVGGFKQADWLIYYQQMQIAYGQPMPRKIVVRNGRVKLILVIDRWMLDGSETN